MSQEPVPFFRPAFIVGVTGNVDPDDDALNSPDPARNIHAIVRRILRFLQHGAAAEGGTLYEQIRAALPDPGHDFGLSRWPGLPHTPIVVLSSLAPGADTIVAEAALDLCLPVRAFLPFAADLYPDASTFVRNRHQPQPEELQDQAVFRRLVARIRPENTHSVLLQSDLTLDEAARHAQMLADRDDTTQDAAGRRPRSYRYEAAGQYIGAHCDLLLALWDDDVRTTAPEGTGKIVEAKLRGLTPGLLPSANAFAWADAGPVLHVYVRRKKNLEPASPAKPTGTLRLLHANDFPPDLLRTPAIKPWWWPVAWLFSVDLSKVLVDQTPRPASPWQRLKRLFVGDPGAAITAPVAPAPTSPAQRPRWAVIAARFFSIDLDRKLAKPKPATRGDLFQATLKELWTIRRSGPANPAYERWIAYRNWQAAGTSFLCRLARNLATFNKDYFDPAHPAQPLIDLLDAKQKGVPIGSLKPGSPPYRLLHEARDTFNALAPLQAARRESATESGKLRARSQRVLLDIFWLVFLFAVSAHILAHWETGPEQVSGQPPGEAAAHQPLVEETAPARAPLPIPVRKIFGVLAVVAGISSLARFWWHRTWRVEERHQDCRALSEGLRVQIAWCLAGLPRSAAGHYMERQRNELEWIRSAMSSLAMPHHRWQRWFRAASALRVERLRWVEKLWVDEQASYHARRSKALTHDLHFFHKTGSVLALSGAILVIASACEACFGWLEAGGTRGYADELQSAGLRLAPLVVAGLLALWSARFVREIREQAKWRPVFWKVFWSAAWSALYEYVNIVVPARHGTHLDAPHGKSRRMMATFLAHLPVALTLALLAAAGCITVQQSPWIELPGPEHLMTIASGVFLVAGALLAAWAEKNLFSEQAYQYNAMASLFSAAKSRLSNALDDLEAFSAQGAASAVDRQIEHIHQILYDLGIEALNENAEWLILHRARPMEPMMAG